MPAGRPTGYDVAYCEKVVEWGKLGKSITWMAAELLISKDTIYRWAKEHPEFSDALNVARALAQQWWEDAGQNGMAGEERINAAIWSRSMAARFPEDWREKSETALTGANGGPLQVEEVRRTVVDPVQRD